MARKLTVEQEKLKTYETETDTRESRIEEVEQGKEDFLKEIWGQSQ